MGAFAKTVENLDSMQRIFGQGRARETCQCQTRRRMFMVVVIYDAFDSWGFPERSSGGLRGGVPGSSGGLPGFSWGSPGKFLAVSPGSPWDSWGRVGFRWWHRGDTRNCLGFLTWYPGHLMAVSWGFLETPGRSLGSWGFPDIGVLQISPISPSAWTCVSYYNLFGGWVREAD